MLIVSLEKQKKEIHEGIDGGREEVSPNEKEGNLIPEKTAEDSPSHKPKCLHLIFICDQKPLAALPFASCSARPNKLFSKLPDTGHCEVGV